MAGPAPRPCPSPVCVRVLSRMGWGPHRDPVSPRHGTHAGATLRDLRVWIWASRSSPQWALWQAGRQTHGQAEARTAQQVHDARGHRAQASLPGREHSPGSERGRCPPESTKPQLNKQSRRQPRPARQAVDFGAGVPIPLPPAWPRPRLSPAPPAQEQAGGGSVPSRTHRPAVCTGGAQAGSGSSSTQEGGSPHPVLRQLELRVPVAPGGCPQGPPGRRWALALGGAVLHPTPFPCLGVPHWVQSSLQWGRGHVSAPG